MAQYFVLMKQGPLELLAARPGKQFMVPADRLYTEETVLAAEAAHPGQVMVVKVKIEKEFDGGSSLVMVIE